MTQIVEKEREKYAHIWNIEAYTAYSPGEEWLPVFLDMAKADPVKARYPWGAVTATTVLDAGAGSGKGALALAAAGFAPTLCDLTDEGLVDEARALPFHPAVLWSDLSRLGSFDYAYCCDVLEHIAPEFTMLVVARLLAVVKQGVFLSIALVNDQFGAFVGEPLHQTVMPYVWWRDRLGELGKVVEARDMIKTAAFFIRRSS